MRNKKIIASLGTITLLIAIIAIGATTAFFSDTETSTGNTFTAGAIDLKVDSEQHYNHMVCQLNPDGLHYWQAEDGYTPVLGDYPDGGTPCGGTWGQPDGKDIVNEKFFNFGDVKPGDSGENTISLHVINNDAWVCAEILNLTDSENGLNEPELSEGDNANSGELSDNLVFTIWRDDGDNIMNGTEVALLSGNPVNGVSALYDSTTGTGALPGGTTGYLGVSWSLPSATGNETQTDSMTGDISFNVVQSRNNTNFTCSGQQIVTAPDTDQDLVVDSQDNCPFIFNQTQVDADNDGKGNACDNCVNTSNADQADTDADGLGNACDSIPDGNGDSDGDGIINSADNCPSVYNPNQTDFDADGIGNACDTPDLFFSEYVKGSSYNKALEIYNPTSSEINLSNYTVKTYFNGNPSSDNLTLSGFLDAGDVYVICNSIGVGLQSTGMCDLYTGSNALDFNGNDAIALQKGSTVLDVIGQIGFNPGVEWGTGNTSTENNTIIRKCEIAEGDTNGNNAFDPASEWNGFVQDTFSYLGLHTHPCLP